MKLKFSGQIFKNPQMSDFLKIRLVGAELFYAEGQTDRMKFIVAFRNFSNATKNFFTNTEPIG
jgi:hypothetical protein